MVKFQLLCIATHPIQSNIRKLSRVQGHNLVYPHRCITRPFPEPFAAISICLTSGIMICHQNLDIPAMSLRPSQTPSYISP